MKNTARQQEAMKQQTIGVEVEMNNIRRDAAAKLAADFFGTGRYKNTAADNGYYCWSAWDDKDREWKFQRDVSIAGPDAEKCEMVTPILTYDDIETLQELVRRLRKAGAKSDPTRGCGVHIHIGAAGHTPQSLRNLAKQTGRPGLPRSPEQEEADHDGGPCRHLVHHAGSFLRQEPALQQQPLPHAEPSRHLYEGDHRVQTFPI